MITAALTTLVFGVVETETYGWSSTRTLITLGLALVLFALAAVIETRTTNALIPFAIVRRGPVATVIAAMLIHGAVMTAAIYFVSLFLQQVRGYTPFMAGVLMLPFGLVVLVMPLIAARLTSQYGPRVVALATPPVAIVALLWLSRWSVQGNVVVQVVLPTMLLGVGVALYFFALTVMLTSTVEREHSGLGSGLFNASRQIGGSVGLAALVVIAAGRSASAHGPSVGQATSAGYSFALVVSAGLVALVMLIVAWHVGHTHRSRARVRRSAGACLPAGCASAPGAAPVE
jgi:predicted MFS family arabinose efflux permease